MAPRTVPRARTTTPPRHATSGAISSATGETRPSWIVTGGREWAGRADTHAGLLDHPPSGVGFARADRVFVAKAIGISGAMRAVVMTGSNGWRPAFLQGAYFLATGVWPL